MNRVAVGIVCVLALFFLVANQIAYADSSHDKYGHRDLEGKFFHKAHFVLSNGDELALSEEQEEAIRELKIELKKKLIRQEAEIDIAAVDIRAELMEDTVDLESVKPLVDKKYALKKEKAYSLVEAYAELKDTLNEEQKQTLKDLWRSKK